MRVKCLAMFRRKIKMATKALLLRGSNMAWLTNARNDKLEIENNVLRSKRAKALERSAIKVFVSFLQFYSWTCFDGKAVWKK